MQPPSPETTLETLSNDHEKLKKTLAKNNALLRRAVIIGIELLDNKQEVRTEDLKQALQALCNELCTRPPGCDPMPEEPSCS